MQITSYLKATAFQLASNPRVMAAVLSPLRLMVSLCKQITNPYNTFPTNVGRNRRVVSVERNKSSITLTLLSKNVVLSLPVLKVQTF